MLSTIIVTAAVTFLLSAAIYEPLFARIHQVNSAVDYLQALPGPLQKQQPAPGDKPVSDLHLPELWNGVRLVCSCGDFNCASLELTLGAIDRDDPVEQAYATTIRDR